ncbi:MAG: MFS transporter [Thermoleophilia bacterium]|nr:MFS transporter [Thermoleophilia bacterium]
MLRPAATLSLTLFANQSATLVLSPILVEVARDFDVSTATAGQLRSVSGAVAAVTALAAGALAGRLGLRRLLLAGLALLVLACGLSAVAPTFAVLAAAQALLGGALAVLLAGAVAGAIAWIAPERRADALSVTFSGQALAWLVGMPVVGLVGAVSWRLTWVALPIAAALVAFALVATLPAVPVPRTSLRADLALLVRDRAIAGWAAGEVLCFSAWTGWLVYSGALLVESYDTPLGTTGGALGVMFLAYLPGSWLARRGLRRAPRRLLAPLALGAAATAAAIGAVRPGLWPTVGLLTVFVLLNSGRTIVGSALGLEAAPGRAVTAMGIRASATQLGYLAGSGLGGLALHLGGYAALGAVFASLYALAVALHALLVRAGPG